MVVILAIVGMVIAVVVGVVFYRADVPLKDFAWWVISILGITVIVCGLMIWRYHSDERWLTCQIKEKDRGSGSDYRVVTSCGTFNNEPAFARFKFNTDAVGLDGRMDKGKTYRLLVAGKPIPNIYDVQAAG